MFLVFVVCVGFVSSFSCLCSPFVCVFLFSSCIGFLVSRVSWLVRCFLLWWASLLGVLVPVYWCLSLWWVVYVYALCMFSSLLCLRSLCAVLSLVPVRVVVLLLVGVSGFIGVCVSLMYMPLMSLVFLSCLSFFVL